jgi:hypothetical protein
MMQLTLVAPVSPSRRNYPLAILAPVQSLNLPDIRLDPRRLQLFNRPNHQARPLVQIVSLLVAAPDCAS